MNRERWPTANGLPVMPSPECYEICPRRSEYQDNHHLAFPRREHRTSLERSYRNSAAMIIKICRCKHTDLHSTYNPPEKPDAQTMRDVIQGNLRPLTEEEADITLQIRSRDVPTS